MDLLHLMIICIMSQSGTVNDDNCCLLGNFTSTDGKADSTSGNIISCLLNIYSLALDDNYC